MALIAELARSACVTEVTARKVGNVHRERDFDSLTYADFLASADAVAPILGNVQYRPVGETILLCVEETRKVVDTNTNLGIILLLAPLAHADEEKDVPAVLRALTVEDAKLTYRAIRLAEPGGMGNVEEQNIDEEPSLTLREVMTLAADRDLIARQYRDDFAVIFDEAVPALRRAWAETGKLDLAVLACQLHLLMRYPDSLIARKRGIDEAERVCQRARAVLDGGWQPVDGWSLEVERFDCWLREDGHSRNPGTTADLIAAALFVAARWGDLASFP